MCLWSRRACFFARIHLAIVFPRWEPVFLSVASAPLWISWLLSRRIWARGSLSKNLGLNFNPVRLLIKYRLEFRLLLKFLEGCTCSFKQKSLSRSILCFWYISRGTIERKDAPGREKDTKIRRNYKTQRTFAFEERFMKHFYCSLCATYFQSETARCVCSSSGFRSSREYKNVKSLASIMVCIHETSRATAERLLLFSDTKVQQLCKQASISVAICK